MSIKEQLIQKVNNKTKPLGSLGILEDIAIQIGEIQQTLSPELKDPVILVFAGDHGLTEENVSPFPKEVTFQMVMNFLNGGAAINVFCKQNNIDIRVIDAGVDYDFKNMPGLIHSKVGFCTKNMLKEPAMSYEECILAMKKGATLVQNEFNNQSNVIGFGEMGIGNTSAAALLMSKFTKQEIENCVGPGTGLDAKGVNHKTQVLKKVAKKYKNLETPLDILSAMGGFEIAMMTGAMLEAAKLKMTLLIDGFIATSALLSAQALNPEIVKNCIFCHQSMEPGHQEMLKHFGVKAILNNGLRLGEGTGAALAYPLVLAAVNFLNEMASFDDAGVSNA
ncbi:MAG: nicotinate-nucleotide--dimethylbenzimidazole phosphoribosyltransferase [Bacteroidetes bacterium]|nr:nicotinate-nucleotide--dimethylbenzimidazole phosphoribosyltransferase [Bacteroidota bacterium]